MQVVPCGPVLEWVAMGQQDGRVAACLGAPVACDLRLVVPVMASAHLQSIAAVFGDCFAQCSDVEDGIGQEDLHGRQQAASRDPSRERSCCYRCQTGSAGPQTQSSGSARDGRWPPG